MYVVKLSVGAINNTHSDMDYNEVKTKEGLLEFKDYIQNAVLKNGSVTYILSIKIATEDHIARLNDALNSVQRALYIY